MRSSGGPRSCSPTSTTLGHGSMLDGVITGIEDNWFQGRIADSAYEQERLFNQGRRTIVGVHGYTEGNDEAQMSLLQITNEDEARQLKRLDEVRHQRDQTAVDAALPACAPKQPTRRST